MFSLCDAATPRGGGPNLAQREALGKDATQGSQPPQGRYKLLPALRIRKAISPL